MIIIRYWLAVRMCSYIIILLITHAGSFFFLANLTWGDESWGRCFFISKFGGIGVWIVWIKDQMNDGEDFVMTDRNWVWSILPLLICMTIRILCCFRQDWSMQFVWFHCIFKVRLGFKNFLFPLLLTKFQGCLM